MLKGDGKVKRNRSSDAVAVTPHIVTWQRAGFVHPSSVLPWIKILYYPAQSILFAQIAAGAAAAAAAASPATQVAGDGGLDLVYPGCLLLGFLSYKGALIVKLIDDLSAKVSMS
jgi:hypothetical protein